MITPKPLFKGARVAIVGASGPISAPDRLTTLTKAVEKLGLVPVIYPSVTAHYGYLAGSDELRAHDLNQAFADTSIDGILLSRGGYGMPRILPMLDYDMIARNPKFISGYSDVTALLTAITQCCSFVTYHMPMPATELYKENIDEYTMSFVRALYFGTDIKFENPVGCELQTLTGGTACGQLIGGNLSLLASSIGTPYEVDTRGKILFIEDVGEEPYRLDGMFTQLRNSGKFNDCLGIVLGAFTDCDVKEPEKSLTLEQVIADIVLPCGKPCISGLVCGHCLPTMSLPMGEHFMLDADKKTLTIL